MDNRAAGQAGQPGQPGQIPGIAAVKRVAGLRFPTRRRLTRSRLLELCVACALALLALSLSLDARAATPAGAPGSPAVSAAPPTMWDLADLYATPQAWQAAYDEANRQAQALGRFKGTLGDGADALYAALDAISAVNKASDRLGVYASLRADEDLRIAVNQERRQQAQNLATLIAAKTSWVAPEIISLGAAKVQRFESERPALKRRFDFFLADTLRAAPHTLGVEAEGVLAAAGNVLAQPEAIHDQLADADLPYPQFQLPDGSTVRLDEPAYEKYRQASDRDERRRVFDAFWGTWLSYQGTVGATLTAQVMGDVFTAQVRHYDSALAAALFQSNMPPAVYHTLVAQTNAALPTLYRYLRLRRAQLGIRGPLAYYDNYVPLFQPAQPPHFSVADAERITLAALAPLGPQYVAMLRSGFASRWMNALPQPGKATGGYMNGSAYDVHPYILLNFNGDYDSMSTVAHEWGHAMHTLLTDAAQPYEKSNYSTFIAESAAISNEMLLNDYMVAHARTRAEKLYYLGAGLESIRTTYFRQVMFAEFELAIHQEIEQGRPLSGARLTQIYCGLLKRYYGEAQGIMRIDPRYCIEWAFVPHFYYDFYVWQYATSMAGAAAITDSILREGAPARDRYFAMLKAGGSDYPYDLYKRAGIDMASPAPYQALAARMNRLMDEIEALQRGGDAGGGGASR
ncbi:MAG TPA: M3 family oligoendopeptidase [Steroidobacteraceae bacterium]|nr:M3 family oligoendopeptidase [Steroidobacteraceae bacterium]